MTITTYHAARRMGKTTLALKILREEPDSMLVCHIGNKAIELSHGNADVEKRILSAYSMKRPVIFKDVKKVIIDDGDCFPLSLLIDWINFCQKKGIEIIITTTT